MPRFAMFSLIVLCLFSFAALSPSLPTTTATQTVQWLNAELELPRALTAAPLSGEDYDEQTYLSEDGAIELRLRQRSLAATTRPVDVYHGALERGWAAECTPVALLDKEVTPVGYRLEWLTADAVVIERLERVGQEWIQLEASAPRDRRVQLRRWVANTALVALATRP